MDVSASSSAVSSNRNQPNENPNTALSTDEQIVSNFYGKFVQCVVQARGQHSTGSGATQRPNRWFNLDTPEVEPLRSEVKYWKRLVSMHQSQPLNQMQPLILDIYLDLSDTSIYPNNNNPQPSYLVIKDEQTMRKQRINPDLLVGVSVDPITGSEFCVRKKRILLESWQLTLLSPRPTNPPDVSIIYRNMTMFFRSLFLYIRLLPVHKICKRYSKQPSKLKVGYRLTSSRVMPLDEVGLDQLHLRDAHRGIAEYNFGALETTLGKLNVHVMYRVECDFTLSEPEPLLSNSFRGTELDENFYSCSNGSNESNQKTTNQSNSSIPKNINEPLDQTRYITPGSFSNSSSNTRRVSAPTMYSGASCLRSNSGGRLPTASPAPRGNQQHPLDISPRSLGAPGVTSSRANNLNHQPMARAVGPQSNTPGGSSFGRNRAVYVGSDGSMRGASPTFQFSGSFPRNHGGIRLENGSAGSNGGASLADAIAMGLFDGVEGLPFSVGRRLNDLGTGRSTGQHSEADQKGLIDMFMGFEETPPFGSFRHRDMSTYPRSGTSVSSNPSVGSIASVSRRNSMNALSHARTGEIPFANTILGMKQDEASFQPSSFNSVSGALTLSKGSNLPIIPGSTPPRPPFVSSIIFNAPALPSRNSFGASNNDLFGVSSAQSPPPFVSMTHRIPNRQILGAPSDSKAPEQLQQQVATIRNELEEFIRGIEGKRKSLVFRHAPGYLNQANNGAEASDGTCTDKRKRPSKNTFAKIAQLKDSYQELSNSLVAATSLSKPAPFQSSTPPPVVFCNSPPGTSNRLGSSPKESHFQPQNNEFLSLSSEQRHTTSSLGRSLPRTAAASYRNEKLQLRKPSSLQFATTKLSAGLSESGNADDTSSGSDEVASEQRSTALPIAKESFLDSRDRAPKKPSHSGGLVTLSIPTEEAHWTCGTKPVHVYTADPARVSSGFFPVSDSSKTGGLEVGTSESKDWSGPSMRPIKCLDTQFLSNQSGAFSSLLSRDVATATAPIGISEAARDIASKEPHSRRKSSGGLLPKVTSGGTAPAPAAAAPFIISSEGGGVVGKNIGIGSSRFGSAPVEVPFGRRMFCDRNRVDPEDSWNIEKDDADV
ncbi:autophagy-related protein 13-domain-containing protein [Chytriomyces cf. hyalinus JEL632]|nr:autophagy-related protein 13-domain-containing protein [Chytriomyces cf. hyalinus JEL632]